MKEVDYKIEGNLGYFPKFTIYKSKNICSINNYDEQVKIKKQIFIKSIVLLLLVALFLLPSCGSSNEGGRGSEGVKEFSTKDANGVLLDKDGIKLTYTD